MKIIKFQMFENTELFNYMDGQSYPYKIKDNLIEFQLDIFNYVCLEDIITVHSKKTYILYKKKLLRYLASQFSDLLNHLNKNNLQYFELEKNNIFLEIKNNEFQRFVLTHPTKQQKQNYILDFESFFPPRTKYQIIKHFLAAKTTELRLSDNFIQILKIPIENYFDNHYETPVSKLLQQHLPSIIFNLIIKDKYHENKIKALIHYYNQTISNDHISNDALEDFLNQDYNQIKFNDMNYIFEKQLEKELRIYNKVYEKQNQNIKKKQLTNQMIAQNIIKELQVQASKLINIDLESINNASLEKNWDLGDKQSINDFLDFLQKKILEMMSKIELQLQKFPNSKKLFQTFLKSRNQIQVLFRTIMFLIYPPIPYLIILKSDIVLTKIYLNRVNIYIHIALSLIYAQNKEEILEYRKHMK